MRQQHHRRGEPAAADVAGTPRCARAGRRPARRRADGRVRHSTCRAGRGRRPAPAGRRRRTPAAGSATTSTSSASAVNSPVRTDSCPGRPSTRNQRRCAGRTRRPGLRMNSTRPFARARPAVERDRRGPGRTPTRPARSGPTGPGARRGTSGRRAARCPPAGRPPARPRRRTAGPAARRPASSRPPGGHHDTLAQQPAHQHDLVGLLHLRQATHRDGCPRSAARARPPR